jgi:LDH2 family malate/lactate/ureidoglycolate dehydrogenase
MEALIAELKSTPRAPNVDEIFYPGEPEALSVTRLRASGIALPEETLRELREEAATLGVTAPF